MKDALVKHWKEEHAVPMRFSGDAGMLIGHDIGGLVDQRYDHRKLFPFADKIKRAAFEVTPQLTRDPGARSSRHGATVDAVSA